MGKRRIVDGFTEIMAVDMTPIKDHANYQCCKYKLDLQSFEEASVHITLRDALTAASALSEDKEHVLELQAGDKWVVHARTKSPGLVVPLYCARDVVCPVCDW